MAAGSSSLAGELSGDFGQAQVAGAGVAAQPVERGVHGQAVVLGEHALGLFDDDPAVEGGLELFVDDLAAADRPFLQDADGGHVGQRLPEGQVGVGQRAGAAVEQVQRADRLAAQPQRQRVHRPEPAGLRDRGGEHRPLVGDGEVGHADRGGGAVAVQAGSLLVLQLQQLHQSRRRRWTRRRRAVRGGRRRA